MADRLSPGSGGPLVDPDGRAWIRKRRQLDLRVVRRALRDSGCLVLLGEAGGFELRWVEPEQRPGLWERIRGQYAGPGGSAAGDYTGHEFVNREGDRLVYVEVSC